MKFEFSKHAREQMELRGIPEDIVETILSNPSEIHQKGDNKVYQSITQDGKYLIRIFVNEKRQVITVYKTSKIKKYYEGEI